MKCFEVIEMIEIEQIYISVKSIYIYTYIQKTNKVNNTVVMLGRVSLILSAQF